MQKNPKNLYIESFTTTLYEITLTSNEGEGDSIHQIPAGARQYLTLGVNEVNGEVIHIGRKQLGGGGEKIREVGLKDSGNKKCRKFLLLKMIYILRILKKGNKKCTLNSNSLDVLLP